jgi:hypothetical protein
MIKIDLTSGFFQLKIHPQHTRFYGIQYRGNQYSLQRLLMGHPLAPSILQRFAAQVAAVLHRNHDIAMVAYLDDWLLFGAQIPVPEILQTIRQLGITINTEKSHLIPTRRLIYLGLDVNLFRQQIQITEVCITHLQALALVPQATQQDLRRITGYVTWLAWAMAWPMYIATHILHRDTYWVRWMLRNNLLQRPRRLAAPNGSTLVYSDATPSIIGVYWPGPPPRYLYRDYLDERPIAFAEIAAALVALIHTAKSAHRATTITLATDSTVAYYVLITGKGKTIRNNVILQELYYTWFSIKCIRGHPRCPVGSDGRQPG